jgi:hypothetical protein
MQERVFPGQTVTRQAACREKERESGLTGNPVLTLLTSRISRLFTWILLKPLRHVKYSLLVLSIKDHMALYTPLFY